MITVPCPSYSPDFEQCDCFLFPKMILQLKGRRVDYVEKIQAESVHILWLLAESQNLLVAPRMLHNTALYYWFTNTYDTFPILLLLQYNQLNLKSNGKF